MGQLSPRVATTEAGTLQLGKPGHHKEKALCHKTSPHTTTRESLHAAMKAQDENLKLKKKKSTQKEPTYQYFKILKEV